MENCYSSRNNSCIRKPFITESLALAVIPFEEALVLPIGSILRLINLVTIILCLIESKELSIQKGKNSPFVPMIAFLLYAAISFVWCFNRTFYLDRLATYSLYIILILFLSNLKPNEKEQERILTGLWIGGVLASVLIAFAGFTRDLGGRETIVLFGRKVDPNILSYSYVLSLIIGMHKVFIKKKQRLLNGLLLIPLFVAVLICGSRGAFVTLFVVAAVIILSVEYRKNAVLKKLLLILFIGAALLLLYFQVVLPSEYGERFSIANLTGQGSLGMANRDLIWSAAFKQIGQRPLLGYGNGASMYAIEAVYRYYGTHNSYILVLLEFGLVGFAIVLMWQFRECRRCFANTDKVYRFLYLSILLYIMFVEGFSTKVFWGVQVLLMVSCCSGNSCERLETR